MTDCKCNTCKFRNDTKIINPCLDCDDFSHYCENEEMVKLKTARGTHCQSKDN